MNTNNTNLHDTFLRLVRLGIGHTDGTSFKFQDSGSIDWVALKALADRQGLTAVVLDGLNSLPLNSLDAYGMPQMMRLEWIGEVLQNYEQRYIRYEKAIGSLAGWYNQHGFKMMVLKGYACSLDWPKPEHRPCGDIDIWLFNQQAAADKELVSSFSAQGSKFEIDTSHHHHTVFEWDGFTVENHYDFVNVHAHKSSAELEKTFKELGQDDTHSVEFRVESLESVKSEKQQVKGVSVYMPSANLHALFLVKHMVSHFAAAEITLRQVLDWAFFVEKHGKEIDWEWLDGMLQKYKMKEFVNCIDAICVGELGFPSSIFAFGVQFNPELKARVLEDILSPEWTAAEPDGFVKRMAYKYRRWQGNAWKQEMCYPEGRFETFWRGLWSHIRKP